MWKFNRVRTGSEDPNKEQLDHNWTRLGYQPIRLFPQLGRLECKIRTAAANGARLGLVESCAGINGPICQGYLVGAIPGSDPRLMSSK